MGNKPIVHAPIATGSTEPRDIRDRFADFINLKDFGAVGDGITDDSSAWAAWQTALQNGGMPYIPKGNYLLGEEIVHAPKGHFGRNVKSFSYEDDGVVLDEFSAPIYLDPAGSDSNDGLSVSSAVKTFAKAIEIGSSLSRQEFKIVVSAGTYTENVEIRETYVVIELAGNVTLSGSFEAYDSILYILESSSNSLFTITGHFALYNVNCLNDVALSVGSESNNVRPVSVSTNSYCIFNKSVTVNASNGLFAVVVSSCSNAFFIGTFTVSGTEISSAITVWNFSSCILQNGINVTATNITNVPIRCEAESHLVINGSIYVPSFTAYTCVYCSTNSYTSIVGTLTVTKKSASGELIYADRGAFIQVSFSGTSVFTANGGNINTFFYANNGSVLILAVENSGTVVKLTGTVNWGTALSTYLSFLQVNPSISFSGSSVTGKRFDVHHCSVIDSTNSGGPNIFPGSTAGTAQSSTYGVYH